MVDNPYALTFNGSSQYAVASGTVNLSNRSFTIAFGARRHRIGVEGFVISQGSNMTTDQVLHLGFRADNTFACGFWGDDLNTSTTTRTPTTTPTPLPIRSATLATGGGFTWR